MGTSTSQIPGRPVSPPPSAPGLRTAPPRPFNHLPSERPAMGLLGHKREPRGQHVPRRSPVPLSPAATRVPGVTASGRYVRCGAVLQTGRGHSGSAEPRPVLT